mmetsp:Transcript_30559/g.86383  ORF Transcript_30559/g.86383 Transcript_30559/m.86383 type:complete len:110 (-) Transcript_30559:3078-3407(-)
MERSGQLAACGPSSGLVDGFLRALRVYTCATKVFLSYRHARAKDKKLKKQLGISEQPDADEHPEMLAFWEGVHEDNAEMTYRNILDLRGLWVKARAQLRTREAGFHFSH